MNRYRLGVDKWLNMSACHAGSLVESFPIGNYVNDVMMRQASSGIGMHRLPGIGQRTANFQASDINLWFR